MQTDTAVNTDLGTLRDLNEDYIRSVQTGDVRRFDEILADDFLCSNPDGTLIDRASFLEQTARPVTIANLEAHDVNVRLMGDFAIIHARTSFTKVDGQPGAGRYTDVWARRDGRWLAVSAHVTPHLTDRVMTKRPAIVSLAGITIDPASAMPLYDALHAAILAQRLTCGARLPPTRVLAATLHISRHTVLNAVEQLVAEGYLEGRHGAGTYIARDLPETYVSVRARLSSHEGAP